MSRFTLTLLCFVVATSSALPQKNNRARKIEPDEILFGNKETILGWRLLVAGSIQDDNSHLFTYYDPIRIEKTSTYNRLIWIKLEEYQDDVLHKYSLTLHKLDCRQKLIGIVEVQDYNELGNPTGNSIVRSVTMRRIIPDSTSEDIYRVICLGQKDQATLNKEEASRWFELARYFEKVGKFNQALHYYENALKYAPGNWKILDGMKRTESRKEPR